MARHHAIAATSNAIRLLLEDASTSSEWTGLDVRLVQAEDLQQPATKTRLTIFLYRVIPSTARRERPPGGVQRPTAIPLELHYLVTACAAEATTAQELLGWAISVLHDTPVIEGDAPDGSRVELAWDPLTPAELAAIWQVAPQTRSPSAAYVARGVALGA
jgi:hypothetical protein